MLITTPQRHPHRSIRLSARVALVPLVLAAAAQSSCGSSRPQYDTTDNGDSPAGAGDTAVPGDGDGGGPSDGGGDGDGDGPGDGPGDGDGDGDDGNGSPENSSSATPSLGGNGDPCDTADDCTSGFCFSWSAGSVCSECTESEHCDIEGQSCVWDPVSGYRVCSAGLLGDLCNADTGCKDSVCHRRPDADFGLCSECRDADHCRDISGGINCTMDLSAGYYRCTSGALGEECYEPQDCASTICRPEGEEAGYGKCSQCIDDADCQASGEGLNCTNSQPENLDEPTYFNCSTGELGEMCDADAGCGLERCTEGHCSECKDAQQCRDEGTGLNCIYLAIERHEGWHRCSEGLPGEACTQDASCQAELHCTLQFEQVTCSHCAVDTDCGTGEVCAVGYPGDFRVCVSEASALQDAYCDVANSGELACAGHCVAVDPVGDDDTGLVPAVGACGECRPDANDCPAAKTCVAPVYISGIGIRGSSCEAHRR